MKKLFLWTIIPFILASCSNLKDNNTISFIRLYPNVLYDTIGNPYLHIEQYVEYRFALKDSLYIGKAESYKTNENGFLQFGLSKFYLRKTDGDFSDLMKKILDANYKESYEKVLGENSIDDRHISILLIYENGTQKIISYCEKERLPNELRLADSLIEQYTGKIDKAISKPNYSVEIITNLQDSLFHRFPPPSRKSTIEFVPPLIENEDVKQK